VSARVVIITDRAQFATEAIAGRLAAILARVPRGAVAIQIREKDLDGGPLLRLAREILGVARPAGAPVWINDRVDLALIAGADGVHLPEHGLPIADARTVARGRTLAIGASRHTEAGVLAAAAEGAEVVQLGPIFATPGKQAVGPAILGVRARLPAATRLVAVGGIDSPERAREAAAAGADAVAVIRAAWTAADPAGLVAAMIDALH
jgi:thiamine-phosphate pyrophosphorylase